MTIPFRRNAFNYTNDAQLKTELIAGNEGAIKYVFYGKYENVLKNVATKAIRGKPIEFDDMRHDFFLFLNENNWAKLRMYDPDKGEFKVWLYQTAFYYFQNYQRKWHYQKIDYSDDITIYDKGGLSRWYNSDLMNDLLRVLPNVKPDRDRVVIEAVVLRDEDPVEIAKRLGVTRANFDNIKRRALFNLIDNYLTGYEENIKWKRKKQ